MSNKISKEEIGSLALSDIRVLWNVNEKSQITDLIVVEFTKENDPQYLYKKYTFDIGNCLSQWNKISIARLIFDIFVRYDFVNEEAKIDAWDNQFLKIKEVVEETGLKYNTCAYQDENGDYYTL